LKRGWYIQPEVLYSGEGVKYTSAFGDRTLALSYVQVPVMFQYYPVSEFYVEVGPELGILASAYVKDNNNNKSNVTGDFNKANISLGVGAGFRATKELGVYLRYNAGLTDLQANNNTTNYSNVLQLGITVRVQ